MSQTYLINTNQAVQQISNPSVRGITTGKTKAFGSTVYVEIEIGINDRKFVPQDDLAPLRANSNGIEDLLQNLQFGKIGDLVRILTFHKISSNLSNVFYAMQASRTDFHAYQFKSVYKFIESFNNRILIADEVGLGKTIEAGLIWLEAKARSDARRLLVVCPSMLREKWKKELRFRFDTKAEIYDARGLINLLEDFQREGRNSQFAAVCSLNSIRQDSVQNALAEFENTPYKFDLVIIDEAHHLRNTGTKSHTVGKILSDITEAMVLLTATPIHLGSQDLYRLLNLLDENEFSEFWQFEQLIIENEPIVKAQNLLRYHPPKIENAREQIEILKDFSSFRNNSNLHQLLTKLETLSPQNHGEIVEAGLLLEKLNLLSSHISRTRKREVTEWRVVRESNSLKVQLNEREADFYRAVTEAVQNRIESFSGNKILAFALMMPQRQMASCIPAMVEHYRKNTFGQTAIDEEILEELGFNADDSETIETTKSWLELEQLVNEWHDDTPDSKFDVLLDALRIRFEREPEAKIIVFSYFKKTLAYLHRRLTKEGFAPVMIHGDIPMDERQELIETFRTNPNRRILLSSEVGAEGIDLQFCRIIINYDLPWNPMKVEQRIGRVDRLGQKADKISIVNFSVSDTIEEKILHRLYERIGIFERSLGDLEPILGELTQQLSFELLSHRLSPEQTSARIEQTRLAAENKRQQEEELVEQSTVFLGSSDYILEQIGAARELGRRITSEDLRRFIEDFLENSNYYGTSLSWNKPQEGFATIKLSSAARNDLHWFCRNQNPPLITSLTQADDNSDVLCFDSEQAQSYAQREMLTHFHPLVKWIKEIHQNNENAFFPTAAVEIKTDIAPVGDYVLAVQFWEFQGIKKSKRIEYEIASLDGKQIESNLEAEKLLQEILHRATTWEYASIITNRENLIKTWEKCSQNLYEKYQAALEVFRQDNENLKQRRENHLEGYIRRKEERLQKAIQTMKDKFATEKQMKGFYAMLEKVHTQSKEEFAKLQAQSQTSEEFKEIVVIVCRVRN